MMNNYCNVIEMDGDCLLGNDLHFERPDAIKQFKKVIKKINPKATAQRMKTAIEEGWFGKGKKNVYLSSPEL